MNLLILLLVGIFGVLLGAFFPTLFWVLLGVAALWAAARKFEQFAENEVRKDRAAAAARRVR